MGGWGGWQEAASLTIGPQGPIQPLSPQTPSNVVFTRSPVNPALLQPLQRPVAKLPFPFFLPVSLEGALMWVHCGSCKRPFSLSISLESDPMIDCCAGIAPLLHCYMSLLLFLTVAHDSCLDLGRKLYINIVSIN